MTLVCLDEVNHRGNRLPLSFSGKFRCASGKSENGQSSGFTVVANSTFKIDIVTLKATISTNEVSILRLTMEEHFEID